MITDLILNVLTMPFTWLLDQIPSFTWPDWFSSSSAGGMGDKAATVAESVAAIGNWVPLDHLVLLMTLMVAAWAFSLAVQSVRWVVSLFTGGGGSL